MVSLGNNLMIWLALIAGKFVLFIATLLIIALTVIIVGLITFPIQGQFTPYHSG